jgi:hypothetical protein
LYHNTDHAEETDEAVVLHPLEYSVLAKLATHWPGSL